MLVITPAVERPGTRLPVKSQESRGEGREALGLFGFRRWFGWGIILVHPKCCKYLVLTAFHVIWIGESRGKGVEKKAEKLLMTV